MCLAPGLALLGTLGCNSKPQVQPPVTYPVTGELTIAGKKPPVGTVVTFEPASLDLRAQGIVDENGKFSTYMIFHGEKLAGAATGAHRVAIVIPIGTDRGGGDRIMLDKEYLVEAKPNHFVLAID